MKTSAGQNCTDSELLSRARAGDGRAMGELLRRHSGGVHAAVWARTRSPSDLDDLMQETFRRALAGISGLREAEKAGAWLYGIALRVASEWLRKKRRKTMSIDGLEGELAAPDQRAGQAESRVERIRRALARLKDAEREVLVLHYMEGLDYKAIAALAGITHAGVSQRLSRARLRIRQLLNNEEAV